MSPSRQSARFIAVRILEQIIKERVSLPQAMGLASIAKAYGALSPADRGFCYHLVMLSLRHYDKLKAFIEFLADKKPRYKRYDRIALALLSGLAQVLFLQTPLYAVQAETRKILTRPSDKAFLKFGFAILQKAHDNQQAFGAQAPVAWRDSWQEHYGKEQAEAMWEAIYEIPPLDLRFKTAEACGRFAKAVADGNIGEIIVQWQDSLRLVSDVVVSDLPFYGEGDWWVQDKAAGLAAEVLAVSAGERVLDLCAAPGGKTAQLLNSGAELVALEKSKSKITILQENLKRLKMACSIIHQDLLKYSPETPFPAVLLDAPCSSDGTLRHNPELPLIKDLSTIELLADAQLRLLSHAYENLLAEGGRMVYSICSLQKQEGEEVMQAFLKAHPQATILPIPNPDRFDVPCHIGKNNTLRTFPSDWHDKGRLDGFFIALIGKPNAN